MKTVKRMFNSVSLIKKSQAKSSYMEKWVRINYAYMSFVCLHHSMYHIINSIAEFSHVSWVSDCAWVTDNENNHNRPRKYSEPVTSYSIPSPISQRKTSEPILQTQRSCPSMQIIYCCSYSFALIDRHYVTKLWYLF